MSSHQLCAKHEHKNKTGARKLTRLWNCKLNNTRDLVVTDWELIIRFLRCKEGEESAHCVTITCQISRYWIRESSPQKIGKEKRRILIAERELVTVHISGLHAQPGTRNFLLQSCNLSSTQLTYYTKKFFHSWRILTEPVILRTYVQNFREFLHIIYLNRMICTCAPHDA